MMNEEYPCKEKPHGGREVFMGVFFVELFVEEVVLWLDLNGMLSRRRG